MTIAPSGDRVVLMTTCDSGGENAVALSSSSASRWTTSEPARPAMDAAGGACTTTRWYCSTSDTAARRTSTTGTGAMLRLARSVPARTSRFSLLRRMRVARWSSWNRLDSWSASCSLLSSASMSCSWRSTRRLAAAGEVDEHAADVGLQRGLLGGEPHGLPVHRVERAGHLADLVAGADRDRLDGDIRRLACAHALDRLREPPLGDVERRAAQQPQRPDQRPRHQHAIVMADEQAEHEDDGVDAREVARGRAAAAAAAAARR